MEEGWMVTRCGNFASSQRRREQQELRDKLKTVGPTAGEFLENKLKTGEYIRCEAHNATFSRDACRQQREMMTRRAKDQHKDDPARLYLSAFFLSQLKKCVGCRHLPRK